jgi:glycosyltransferase involved in cell wall biosynthesis
VSPDDKESALFHVFRFLTILACKRADLTVVPSTFFANELLKVSNKNITTFIYPSGGVDRSTFMDNRVSNNSVQKSFTFGFVGRMEVMKGIFDLLEAFSMLSKTCNNVKLIFVGSGADFVKAQKICSEKGIDNLVSFMGALNGKELVSAYNSFDCLVFPTHFKESFGNVAIEAMACGNPVIGARHGAIPEYICDEVNGVTFNPFDVEDLYHKMRWLCSLEPKQFNSMRHAAKNKARQFDRDVLTDGFIDKLEGLCEPR